VPQSREEEGAAWSGVSSEAVDGGRQLPLGGKRPRAVLAVLLLHRNQPVSLETIVESLWGGRPPPTAAKTVQVYVSRLRKVLPPGRLTYRPGGYALEVEDAELDLARFERLVAKAGETESSAAAAALLGEALSLFRGPPFAELEFVQAEKAQIDELRLAALEARIEAELALGAHDRLVGELGALVAEHPLSERLRAQLMLALYRSGRQAEALDVFRQARQTLVDELGLEPGPLLQDLEVRILNHDQALLPARSDPTESERLRALLERGRTRVAAEMEELDEVREAALSLGDPETEAEAESWLGQLAWTRGDQAGCFSHLERARMLTERRPPSKAKALVLDLLSRRYMTAAVYDEAVRFGREALDLCTRLGDDEGRVESLNTVGTARAFSGDRDGIADLDAAIAIARVHAAPRALARACLNLAVVLEHYGVEAARVPELESEGLAGAERARDVPLIRAFGAREPMRAVSEGRWNDAKRVCDEFIEEARDAEEALQLWVESGLAYPPAGWIIGAAFVLAESVELREALAAESPHSGSRRRARWPPETGSRPPTWSRRPASARPRPGFGCGRRRRSSRPAASRRRTSSSSGPSPSTGRPERRSTFGVRRR